MRNLSKFALSVLSTLFASSVVAQCPIGGPCPYRQGGNVNSYPDNSPSYSYVYQQRSFDPAESRGYASNHRDFYADRGYSGNYSYNYQNRDNNSGYNYPAYDYGSNYSNNLSYGYDNSNCNYCSPCNQNWDNGYSAYSTRNDAGYSNDWGAGQFQSDRSSYNYNYNSNMNDQSNYPGRNNPSRNNQPKNLSYQISSSRYQNQAPSPINYNSIGYYDPQTKTSSESNADVKNPNTTNEE